MRKQQQQEARQPFSPPKQSALLTPREAANWLRVSARTLLYWTAPGRKKPRLSSVKLGKAKRFVVADILRFIEAQKVKGA